MNNMYRLSNFEITVYSTKRQIYAQLDAIVWHKRNPSQAMQILVMDLGIRKIPSNIYELLKFPHGMSRAGSGPRHGASAC